MIFYNGNMNKTIITSIAILVLVGTGSHFIVHPAEARGMPQHWLNSDGTVKQQYIPILEVHQHLMQHFH
jgi:hypothetical protein